jgi:glyoxylase-like metal-dependent hydrolase (beta-lactamase superfamily II)
MRLPLPFPIGGVNAYLLDGDPLTLIDTGTRWPPSVAALEHALAGRGRRVEDVELLFLTHHHDDHAGLAQVIRERSGCVVAAHELVADLLADEPASRAAEERYAAGLLRSNGAPPEIVATVAETSRAARAMVASVTVDRRLCDGDAILAGGREHRVHLRPGHSPTDTLLVDDSGVALVGDHLLSRTTPALLAHHRSAAVEEIGRPRLLPQYRASLAATRALDLQLALPGHGAAIEAPSAEIDRRLAEQETRASDLLRRLPGKPVSAWETVVASWPGRRLDSNGHPVSMSFVLACDMLALLDLLLEQGQVVEHHGEDGVIRYAPRPA